MPSLSSLPSPATANLSNYSKNFNKNRWNAFPNSEQALMELINDGRAKQNATVITLSTSKAALPFPRVLSKKEYDHLGEFLRQEHLAGSSQIICHYRNVSSLSSAYSSDRSSTISLICELGCCPEISGGCCTLNESGRTNTPPSYHWVIILLCMFVLFVFVSSLAMFVLYWSNRRRELQLMQRRMLSSEKCFSVLSGSSTIEGNYATSSVFTADAVPIRPIQRPFSPKFWHFFNQQPPPTPNPSNLLRLDQIHQLSRQHYRQNHNNNNNHHHHQQQHSHSPSSSASSTYHVPVEMFFRSAL